MNTEHLLPLFFRVLLVAIAVVIAIISTAAFVIDDLPLSVLILCFLLSGLCLHETADRRTFAVYLVVYDTIFGICHESGRVFLTRSSALELASERAADPSDHHHRVGIVRARFGIRDCLRFGWRHAWRPGPETTIVWLPDTRPHPSDCIRLECTNDPIDLYGDF